MEAEIASSESDVDDGSLGEETGEEDKKGKQPQEKGKRQRDAAADATTPQTNDVLLGRGRPFQNSTGNRRMLRIVSKYKVEYASQPREDKRAFVEIILDKVLLGGTRFLRRKERTSASGAQEWEQVDRATAADKVWHILRAKDKSAADDYSVNESGEAIGANHPSSFQQHASTPFSQQIMHVDESAAQRQPQIDAQIMQSLQRAIAGLTSTSLSVHSQLQDSHNRIPSTGANNDSTSGGQGLSIALQILDATLRELIAKLSQTSVAIQLAAAIAGLPIPPVHVGLSLESVQVAIQVALAARHGTSSGAAPSLVEVGQVIQWLQQQLQSLKSDLDDVAIGSPTPRRDR